MCVGPCDEFEVKMYALCISFLGDTVVNPVTRLNSCFLLCRFTYQRVFYSLIVSLVCRLLFCAKHKHFYFNLCFVQKQVIVSLLLHVFPYITGHVRVA